MPLSRVWFLVLICWLFSFTSAGADGSYSARPFPQHVTYAAGTTLPNHVSQNQLDTDIQNFYDLWKTRYLIPAGEEADGHPRYRVEHGNSSTVSEGQGYGMILAVYLAGYDPDAQIIFDGLWEFSLDHPSILDGRLMDWFVNGDESPDAVGDDSAFDGDCDMAYALLAAEQQWGNGGRFNYGTEAARVLSGVLQSTIGPQSRLPLLGDWIQPNDVDFNQWTVRTSDIMPDHFRVFSLLTADPVWNEALIACQDLVDQVQGDFSPGTGLLPDFLVQEEAPSLPLQPAPPHFLEGPDDGKFDYNACRDPWRLGTHALVTGNSRSLAQVRLMAQWAFAATGGNPTALRAGYDLDGVAQSDADYFTTAFAAPMAVACMAEPGQQAFLNGLYDAIKNSQEEYYEDTLTALCMLVLSGNWWTPELPATPAGESGRSSLTCPFPNPFNPMTTIHFAVGRTGPVSLQVFDTRGRLVKRLTGENLATGEYRRIWDGSTDAGAKTSAGVYYLRLITVDGAKTAKLTLIK